MEDFFEECQECGQMFNGDQLDDGLCADCWSDVQDYDDDSDLWEEDDWDNPFSLFDPYWSGDVPDPFDQKVKPRRRWFLKWARHRKNRYCYQLHYYFLRKWVHGPAF